MAATTIVSYKSSNSDDTQVSLANPLPVVGGVGGFSGQLAPPITVQNAAYSAGNSLGGLITVANAARVAGGTGALLDFMLKSLGGSTNTIWVYAWSKLPAATIVDKSAYVAAAADSPYALVGFPMSVTLAAAPGAWDTATYATATQINAVYDNQDAVASTNLYVALVTAGTVTPASTADLSISIGVLKD